MAKIIIDMDDDRFKRIKCETESYLDYQILLAKLNNATVLPTNATNGDVFKALFNVEDDDIKTFKLSNMAIVDTWDWRMDMKLDWWNAPYEGGEE